MKATFLKGVVLGCVVSLVMLTATAAFAGTGVGGVFNLGKYNVVNGATALAGSTAGNQLHVTNTSNGSGATGIAIDVHSGKPPLTVNSATQVQNLNASYLQGKKASAFVQGTGSAHGATLNVPVAGFTGMGAVGSFGGLTAYCQSGGFTDAGVALDTTKVQLIRKWATGNAFLVAKLGSNSHFILAASSALDMETVQFTSGTEVATATIGWGYSLDSGCDFSVQVVDTVG